MLERRGGKGEVEERNVGVTLTQLVFILTVAVLALGA